MFEEAEMSPRMAKIPSDLRNLLDDVSFANDAFRWLNQRFLQRCELFVQKMEKHMMSLRCQLVDL